MLAKTNLSSGPTLETRLIASGIYLLARLKSGVQTSGLVPWGLVGYAQDSVAFPHGTCEPV